MDYYYKIAKCRNIIKIILRRMSIEDHSQSHLQLNLSKASSYLLGLAQVKGNTLEQEILYLFQAKYTGNETKKLIKIGVDVIDNLGAVFKELGILRTYQVIKRAADSLCTICGNLVEIIDKQKKKSINLTKNLQVRSSIMPNIISIPTIDPIEEAKKHLKINRMKGVSLYNQNYKRKIDSQAALQQQAEAAKRKKQEEQREETNEREFKKNLFDKLKKQLKQVQEDLYSPFPDQISTFLIFEKKFLESFNHLSHVEDIEVLLNYLENSRISALDLVNKTEDMSEQISKLKSEVEQLLRQAKVRGQQRDQSISKKFQQIIKNFLQKRVKQFQSTREKMMMYQKLVVDKQSKKVTIGTQTHTKQLCTIKTLQKRTNQLQSKYKFREQEKDRAYKTMLQKTDTQRNQLQSQLTKYKIENRNLVQQIEQFKKQNAKILQKLYDKKTTVKDQNDKQKDKQRGADAPIYASSQDDYVIKRKEKKTSVLSSNLSRISVVKEHAGGEKQDGQLKDGNSGNKMHGSNFLSIEEQEDELKTVNAMTQRKYENEIYKNQQEIEQKQKERAEIKNSFESNTFSIVNSPAYKQQEQITKSAVLIGAQKSEQSIRQKQINTANVIPLGTNHHVKIQYNEILKDKNNLQQRQKVFQSIKLEIPQQNKQNNTQILKQQESCKIVQQSECFSNVNNSIINLSSIERRQKIDIQKVKAQSLQHTHNDLIKKKAISNSYVEQNKKMHQINSLHNGIAYQRNSASSHKQLHKTARNISNKLSPKSRYMDNVISTSYENYKYEEQACQYEFQIQKLYSLSINSGKVVQFNTSPRNSALSQAQIFCLGSGAKFSKDDLKEFVIGGHPLRRTKQFNQKQGQIHLKNHGYMKLIENRHKKVANKYSNSLHLGRSLDKLNFSKEQPLNTSDFSIDVKGFMKHRQPHVLHLDNSYQVFDGKENQATRFDEIQSRKYISNAISKQTSMHKKKFARQIQILELRKRLDRCLPPTEPSKNRQISPRQRLLIFEKIKTKDSEKLKKMWRKKNEFGSLYKKIRYDDTSYQAINHEKLPEINVKSIF